MIHYKDNKKYDSAMSNVSITPTIIRLLDGGNVS